MRISGRALVPACVAFTLAFGGCGGGSHAATKAAGTAVAKTTTTTSARTAPAPGPSRFEKLESACNEAGARLKGIAKEAGLVDPQRAALEGHRLTRRLERGVKESVAVLHISERSLERLDAPDRARLALAEASQAFGAFKERLRAHVPRNWAAGLRLGFRFQRIGLEAGLKCTHSLGGAAQ